MKRKRYVIVMVAVALATAMAENRVLRYNGPGNGRDYAADVAVDDAGNVYVAGTSTGSGTDLDFTVLCFSPEDSLRWVWRWNQAGSAKDVARGVAVGPDGNVYACGFSGNTIPDYDVVVASLTPAGEERWVSIHRGEGGYADSASAIAIDADGNIYTAGVGDDLFGENTEFTVLSFEPDSGRLRWVYYASADYIDEATDVAVGPDSVVFASGVLWSGAYRSGYTIAAVNTGNGSERWRDYLARGDDDSRAAAVACRDGRVYGAGHTGGNFNDFTVTAHDADTGGRDWAWYYSASTSLSDKAFDVAVGPDGNVYSCGRTIDATITQRFTVASLTPGGTRRWLYCDTSGPEGRFEEARELAIGPGNRVYVAGWRDAGWPFDGDEAVVMCLDDTGAVQWTYRYDHVRDSIDLAEAVAVSSGDRVYAVGTSWSAEGGNDIIVLSLDANPPGVEEIENGELRIEKGGPTVVRGVLRTADGSSTSSSWLLDASGRRVMDLVSGPNDVRRLAPGVYFVHRAPGVTKVIIQR